MTARIAHAAASRSMNVRRTDPTLPLANRDGSGSKPTRTDSVLVARVIERAIVYSDRLDAESRRQFSSSGRADAKNPAVEIASHPFLLQRQPQHGGAQGAAKVRAPLAPVEALECESAPKCARALDVDAERLERGASRGRELAAAAGAAGSTEPAERREPCKQRHSERAGDVVVAGARAAQAMRGPSARRPRPAPPSTSSMPRARPRLPAGRGCSSAACPVQRPSPGAASSGAASARSRWRGSRQRRLRAPCSSSRGRPSGCRASGCGPVRRWRPRSAPPPRPGR